MAKNQFKIWRDDFMRFYKRTSFLARIITCAIISFIIAYVMINKFIKPQNEEIKELKKKADTIKVIDDVNVEIADLKNKQRKVFMAVESLKNTNNELALIYGSLNQTEIGKNILELRKLIDENDLRILSEERIGNSGDTSNYNSAKNDSSSYISIKFPSCFSSESYKFELLGTYASLRKFLIDAYFSESLFFINNIKIVETKEQISDDEFNLYNALKCSFEVHIPYLNSGAL